MRLFEAYIAVDWSAAKSRGRGTASIWIAFLGRDQPPIVENPPTRASATERVREILVERAAAGDRVLVGFDFAYCFPRGFADAVAPGEGPPWRRVWDLLSALVVDRDDNANNRLEVAATLNERVGHVVFWGSGDSRLPPTKPRAPTLPEFRAVEHELRRHGSYPKAVWKLSYAGSVGSQVLLGIPRVGALRDDHDVAAVSAVWPFETGFSVAGDVQVVHAEIYPTLGADRRRLHAIVDAHQVLSTVTRWAELDAAGELGRLFEPPACVRPAEMEVVSREEGWILGAPQLVRPAAVPRQRGRLAAPAGGGAIVFAAIAPHGGPVFDLPESETRRGMEELARRHAAARPDATIVATPHGVHVEGQFAVVLSSRLEGDASQWTPVDTHLSCPGEPELARSCLDALRADGVGAAGVTFGSSGYATSTMPLDWGALIPLWFMGGRADPPVPAVVVSSSRERSPREHVAAGRALARAARASGMRVAFVASADHGHGHDPSGPYGFAPESRAYDARIVELVRANRLRELLVLDVAFVEAAKADSFWQLLMIHGAIGEEFRVELLSYEVPTYFGMLCAAFEPRRVSPR